MIDQLDLFAPDRIRYSYVDCVDERGNRWCHLVSDPEETVRFIERELPGVKAEVRKR